VVRQSSLKRKSNAEVQRKPGTQRKSIAKREIRSTQVSNTAKRTQ
jgi:hypothetical protein